jgi:3-oxoacyl-(acyl-carrier-protein) synthase
LWVALEGSGSAQPTLRGGLWAVKPRPHDTIRPLNPRLPARQVLVTIGTPCAMSAVGSTETHRAMVRGDRRATAFAACDAGLVTADTKQSSADDPVFAHVDGELGGNPVTIDEIERRWGATLRANMGIRVLPRERVAGHVAADLAAPLPHDLEDGGLRRLAGLTFADLRQSPLADMAGLFNDDFRLGPSLQSVLFLYGALGALAALPVPLAQLVPEPHRFLLAAGCAFPGNDSFARLSVGMQPRREAGGDRTSDKLAYRLAAALSTHGPGLAVTMLAPAFSLSRVRRQPQLLDHLVGPHDGFRRVPQAPVVVNAACASALSALGTAAPQLLLSYPGYVAPDVLLWTAADAGLQPDARILEGFGLGALMSTGKLDEINAGRSPEARRGPADCLAPFDVDAQGTIVGNAGSGVIVTTLEFALENFLDVTSIVVGWGQSSETGGKAHLAGVGYGGENAMIHALQMAHEGHGYGVDDFGYYVAHATGTRTNSRSDLTGAGAARRVAAEAQGHRGRLSPMTVGAPKAIGDGHTMGETGLKAVGEGIYHVLGQPAMGIPTLRTIDPELGPVVEDFVLSAAPCPGNPDGGALVATQGFAGFNAAVALRAATPGALRRYTIVPARLDAYLERWSQIRAERIEREASYRRTRGFVLRLAAEHRWTEAR